MRKKKMLSTVLAGALVASWAVMPAMAADDELTVNITPTVTSATIRVEVPTTMAIAFDEFNILESGTQISSPEFTMTNKSTSNVRVDVASTAAMGSTGAALVDSVQAVKESTNTKGDMWLAAAAQVAAGSYGAEKTAGDLTDKDTNVTTFDSTSKTETQSFYLAKGSGDVEYIYLAPSSTGDDGDFGSYGQIYELTAATFTDNAALQTSVASNDVYYAATSALTKTGDALTKIAKGSTIEDNTWNASNTYYTVDPTSTTAVAGSAVDSSKKYVVAQTPDAAAEGGVAAFRYVGRLSTKADDAAWDASDLTKVEVVYSFTGVGVDVFNEKVADCAYGFYIKPIAPSVAKVTTTQKLEAGKEYKLTFSMGVGTLAAANVDIQWSKLEGTSINEFFTVDEDGYLVLSADAVDYILTEGGSSLGNLVFTFTDEEGETIGTPTTIALTK